MQYILIYSTNVSYMIKFIKNYNHKHVHAYKNIHYL